MSLGGGGATPRTRGADRPSTVPEDLYASWGPTISPTGDEVAFISDRGGLPEVWIRSTAGGGPRPVPLDGQRVTAVTWSPIGDWLACTVAPAGASRTEVWAVRPDGTHAHMVAGAAPRTAVVAGGRSRGWAADGHLVVTELGEDAQVRLVDLARGETTVLADGGLLAEGELLVALDVTPDGRRLLLRRGPRGARDIVVHDVGDRQLGPPMVERTRGGSSDLGCLSPDGSLALICTDADRDRAELVAVAVAHGEPTSTSVVGRPDGELEDLALSADGRVAALTWNVQGGLSAVTLLAVDGGEQRAVAPLPRPVVHGCQLSTDGSLLVLAAEGPADPRGVWTLDVASALAGGRGPDAELAPLSSPGVGPLHASKGASTDSIDPSEVVVPELVQVRSPDGTPVSGWLYSPGAIGPFPTLIWLHGGPEAQERPVYSSLFQSLLAEGVAVFTPNVRGSTGHGRAFRQADDGVARLRSFEDVAACATHLIDIGVAQRGRLGVAGRSYGGYLTLVSLVRYPELFTVGVAVCPMSDLETFFATTEPWIAAAAVSKYGHPEHDRDLLRQLSPIHSVDRIRAPLLLVHGEDDTNVPYTESLQMAEALAEHGLPHRLLSFEGEGHELLATPNRVAFVHATVDWVVEYLIRVPASESATLREIAGDVVAGNQPPDCAPSEPTP